MTLNYKQMQKSCQSSERTA